MQKNVTFKMARKNKNKTLPLNNNNNKNNFNNVNKSFGNQNNKNQKNIS